MDGQAGLAGLDQPRKHPPLHAAPTRPMLHRVFEIAGRRERSRVMCFAVIEFRIRRAEQDLQQLLRPASDKCRAELVIVPAIAEPLLAKIVGHTASLDDIEHWPKSYDVGWSDL